ncbi:MAG TPA: CNNM domain-containing protein [Bauldia sp.]|nr:CNNM domain-containing protein [Bauldia sp.]
MNAIALNLILAVLLLGANAFFVAAEFALVKSRGFRVDAMANDGRFGASLAQGMLKKVEAYLACCQLGVTMASLGLGWIGEPTVAALLRPVLAPLGMPESGLDFISFIVGFLAFSSLHIVLGEQVPKTFAIREPEPVAQWIAWPLQVVYVVFFPLNWLLNAAASGILSAFGVREGSHQEILAPAEIEGLVDVSAEHGKVEESQAEYIHNLFRFGELEVADVMVHRTNMQTVNADDPIDKIVDEVVASAYTRVPMWEGKPENIIGVIHAKDLLARLKNVGGDLSKIDIRVIAKKPWFVPDTTPLNDQLNAFLKRKLHIALIVDEYGEVQGLLTLEDILEEIVGDIADEYDTTAEGIRKQPDGSVNVDGAVPIRDLNRVMGWSLPDEEATTIAGLVIHEARIIPEPGQAFTFHGLRFQVLRRNRNRITALRITSADAQKPRPQANAPVAANAAGPPRS